jgi:hypothetical protein
MAPPRPQRRIDGIYELGHVLYALDRATHGFGREDIARVERFWCLSDMHSSEAAFVLNLKDGRRAWVEFEHWHGFEQIEDFRIDTAFLPDATSLPKLNSPNAPKDGGWSTDTTHLERVLRS